MLFAVSVLAGAPAHPDAGRPLPERTKIEAYLATHDVPSASALRTFAPIPETALIAIASDEAVERLTRARAVAALRLLPSPAVQEFLIKLVQSKATTTDPTNRLLLRRAAVALGWLAGADAPDQLAPLFENDDEDVRVDAVLGISMSRAWNAAETLRKRLAIESSPRVRQQIERQLVALAGPAPETSKAPSSKEQRPSRQPMRGGF
jgi:hypothetical protein